MSALPAARFEHVSLAVGAIGALACFAGLAGDRGALALSYLSAYLFWTGISVGALALLMVHGLTGGAWGDAIREPLRAAIRALPLIALLFVPLVFGLSALYVWARPGASGASALLAHKSWYLDTPFFLGRAVAYFAIWIVLGLRLTRRAVPGESDRATPWSAGGLILYTLTTTFAAVDWLMALMPAWYSTVFGLMVGVGHALSALAFAIVAAIALPGDARDSPRVRHDLGNLLLMLLLLWSYLAFMEYLTIWVGNQPGPISWYVPRVESSWRWLGVFLMLFHFAVPFVLLLSREAKRSVRILCAIAGLMLVAHWADSLWLVTPSVETAEFRLRWSDFAALVAIGGLWLAVVGWQWRAGETDTLARPLDAKRHG